MVRKIEEKNSAARKMVGWIGIVAMVMNLLLFALHITDPLQFWIGIIIVSAIAFGTLYFLKR